ncbi:hypothetical protein [Haloterrigena alkaliphila]|uniref:PKD domain-containing protein n=1 Tax=Haloterrigena alkaliphila TaxID=2816475 RepID=A0A8A2VGH5_9EURY|nr:hypothetical protein [Haloterrigena alkaliphila]QSW99780.1 hypothetical protein J0X25_02120 [Haloterrigena alkaliphila]
MASGATALAAVSSIAAGADGSETVGYGGDGYGAGGYGGVDDSEPVDGSEREESVGPVIDRLELRDRSNPQWARVGVDWSVSHSDELLAEVESVLTGDGWGSISESTGVSGSNAAGEHGHRVRKGHGERYEVELTVTDTNGNTATETATIDL